MSSFQESVSAALADKIDDGSEVPLIPRRRAEEGPLHLDDVQSLDESPSPGIYSRNVLLSLAGLVSIDSRCIGRLLAVHKRFCQGGGKLAVHSIRPQAMGILKFLRLDLVLDIAENEAAARRLLRASGAVGAK
ncbi:MAG: hypothetical protein A2V98_24010 [Planctomycetes bacterium RBG_16_64_12]|nr:MAG: hypothetical protein A2V98_24010 [Planctomycetes bacterium RBG_16_64_12]